MWNDGLERLDIHGEEIPMITTESKIFENAKCSRGIFDVCG